MKNFKIYLDTSVISMLDNSGRGVITKKFFEAANKNNCELIISEIVNKEIIDAEISKKDAILFFLDTLKYTLIPYNQKSYYLAWNYVFDGILTHNHIADLLHVAYATVHECDMIVSWNRKHIAKPIKIQKINACNLKNNYNVIAIFTPEEFLTYFK